MKQLKDSPMKQLNTPPAAAPAASQILRRPAVEALLQVSRSTIYDWMNPASKNHRPDFPKPIRLGGMARSGSGSGSGAVGWVAAELEAYLAAIVAQRNADHSEGGKA